MSLLLREWRSLLGNLESNLKGKQKERMNGHFFSGGRGIYASGYSIALGT